MLLKRCAAKLTSQDELHIYGADIDRASLMLLFGPVRLALFIFCIRFIIQLANTAGMEPDLGV